MMNNKSNDQGFSLDTIKTAMMQSFELSSMLERTGML